MTLSFITGLVLGLACLPFVAWVRNMRKARLPLAEPPESDADLDPPPPGLMATPSGTVGGLPLILLPAGLTPGVRWVIATTVVDPTGYAQLSEGCLVRVRLHEADRMIYPGETFLVQAEGQRGDAR